MVDNVNKDNIKRHRLQNNNNNNNNNNNKEQKDRLSALPDDILVDILSHLPIETAASTSVLSYRWLNLWTRITSVFINKNYFSTTNHDKVRNFIITSPPLTSPEINKFEIYIPDHKADVLNNEDHKHRWNCVINYYQHWLTKVFERHVKVFKLSIEGSEGLSELRYLLKVRNCQSLVELYLDAWGDIRWFIVDDKNISFPNMKVLDITMNKHKLSFFSRLIKACPLLEHLKLEGDPDVSEDDDVLEILALNLKRLIIIMDDPDICKSVIIDAPKLEFYEMLEHNNKSRYTFVKTPKYLVEAKICRGCQMIYHPKVLLDSKLSLYAAVSSVTTLTIHGDVLYDFSVVSGETCSVFSNVTHLKVAIQYPNHWEGFLGLIKCMPNLQVLDIPVALGRDGLYYDWLGCDHVPTCVSTKIKVINMWMLQADDYGLEVIRYFLKFANALEDLQLQVGYFKRSNTRQSQLIKELEFCKKLYKFPRSSLACKISFTGFYVNVSAKKFKVRALDI